MRLYHGTSSHNLHAISKKGIIPRGERKGNWKHTVDSHANAVYLTNAYAVFFANAACTGNENLAILEVDTDKLNPFAFAPDEDFLEQAGRGHDGFTGDMKSRTRKYRDIQHRFMGSLDDAPIASSLKHLGNCVYFGNVPQEAITRVAVLDLKGGEDAKKFIYDTFDPTITLMNYKILGASYRNSLRWLFNEPESDMETTTFRPQQWPMGRTGITVGSLQELGEKTHARVGRDR